MVEPTDPSYWPAVDRHLTLTLDDLLVEDGHIALFHQWKIVHRHGDQLSIDQDQPLPGQASTP